MTTDHRPDGSGVGSEPAERAVAGPRRRAPYIAGAVAVVIVALVVILARGKGGLDTPGPSPLIGRPAPAVVGGTTEGGSYDLSTRKGSWVVVNFFQTTCTPCKQEHPELRSFVERGGKAELVTVVWSDTPAKVRAFFAANGGSWPVVNDPENRISVAYGVTAVPETFVIDRDGVVRQHITGRTTAARLDLILSQLGAGG